MVALALGPGWSLLQATARKDGSKLCSSHATRLAAPVLVYDGACGFCTSAVHWARRLAPGAYEALAWQGADLGALGLSERSCQLAVQWVGTSGEHYEGAAAFSALLRSSDRAPVRALGRLLSRPAVSRLSGAAYALVAANRHRLPGGTSACRGAPGPSARQLGRR